MNADHKVQCALSRDDIPGILPQCGSGYDKSKNFDTGLSLVKTWLRQDPDIEPRAVCYIRVPMQSIVRVTLCPTTTKPRTPNVGFHLRSGTCLVTEE
jgi:hypothetical protein